MNVKVDEMPHKKSLIGELWEFIALHGEFGKNVTVDIKTWGGRGSDFSWGAATE